MLRGSAGFWSSDEWRILNDELDMIQTAGIGALALLVGMVLTRKVALLQKYCVPSPVSGGIIFSAQYRYHHALPEYSVIYR